MYRLTDLWKRIKSRHLYLCIYATVCGLRWRLTNLRDKWRNEFCGKIYWDIDYSHRMVQSKSRLNEWKTCLVKIVQFYVHVHPPCTFHVRLKFSNIVCSTRLLIVDCRSKSEEIEKFISVSRYTCIYNACIMKGT